MYIAVAKMISMKQKHIGFLVDNRVHKQINELVKKLSEQRRRKVSRTELIVELIQERYTKETSDNV